MRDEHDTQKGDSASPDKASGESSTEWNGSHLIAHAFWAMTLLPVGLPRASATWEEAAVVGTITSPRIRELSGLAVSGHRPDYLWAHNDSGDTPRLFLLGRGGALLGTLGLDVPGSYDLEDIAAGPCEVGTERRCLFVGDIGDNRHVRKKAWVWRFEEPDPLEVVRGEVTAVTSDHVWVFSHEGRAHDAEGLFVDPRTARPYVVQKSREGPTRIMELPEQADGPMTRGDARAVGAIELRGEPTRAGRLATAADMVRAGRACVGVRTYAWVWTACSDRSDATLDELISGEWERTRVGAMLQSEAFAFEPDARGALISSEGWLAPILRMPAR